jgi:catechol 2,3-dioxygenase-like lactoylglutathione lyase family enzyme
MQQSVRTLGRRFNFQFARMKAGFRRNARQARWHKEDRVGSDLKLMQVALNTCDLAGSLAFYSEVFGFANGGGQVGWGEVMRLQGLDRSDRFLLWWMIGRQQSVQFEMFHHSQPAQRPQPRDWSPVDHGWNRIGIGVPDFDGTLAALARWDVTPITAPVRMGPGRRIAIRDPFAGIIIEIIEETDELAPGLRRRHFDLDPFIVYAAVSVADIDQARHFFGNIVGLPLSDNNDLHAPEDESLWGLASVSRKSVVVDAGDIKIEVVEYCSPRGRPKADDHRISDQGMMNIALRSTERGRVQDVIDQAIADGSPPTAVISGNGMLVTYIQDRDRELELIGAPPEADPAIGGLFPSGPLMGMSIRADMFTA